MVFKELDRTHAAGFATANTLDQIKADINANFAMALANFEVDTGTGINFLYATKPVEDPGNIAEFRFQSQNTGEAGWGTTNISASAETGISLVQGSAAIYLTNNGEIVTEGAVLVFNNNTVLTNFSDNFGAGNNELLITRALGSSSYAAFGFRSQSEDFTNIGITCNAEEGFQVYRGAGVETSIQLNDTIVLSAFFGSATVTLADGEIGLSAPYVHINDAPVLTRDVIQAEGVPATASSAGVAGTIAKDANYLYLCVATNTWKRAPLSTW